MYVEGFDIFMWVVVFGDVKDGCCVWGFGISVIVYGVGFIFWLYLVLC